MNETSVRARSTEQVRRSRTGSTRTCVGCGARDAREATLRLVVDDGRVVASLPPDIANEAPRRGRGAHIHPRAACLKRAPKGLARAFRRQIDVRAESLAKDVAARAKNAIASSLESAAALGAIATFDGSLAEDEILGVASDAPEVLRLAGVENVITKGKAFVLASKAELGRLLGVSEATAIVVRHPRLAERIVAARAVIDSIGSGFSLEDG